MVVYLRSTTTGRCAISEYNEGMLIKDILYMTRDEIITSYTGTRDDLTLEQDLINFRSMEELL